MQDRMVTIIRRSQPVAAPEWSEARTYYSIMDVSFDSTARSGWRYRIHFMDRTQTAMLIGPDGCPIETSPLIPIGGDWYATPNLRHGADIVEYVRFHNG